MVSCLFTNDIKNRRKTLSAQIVLSVIKANAKPQHQMINYIDININIYCT